MIDCGDCGRLISTTRGRGAGVGDVERLHAAGDPGGRLPVAEARLEERPDPGEREIADHEDRRIVRPDPGPVETDQLVAGQRLDDGQVARAGERLPVWMRGAVDQAGKGAERHALRRRHLLPDAGKLLLPDALHLRGGEGRVADHVGQQIERGAELGAERGQRNRGAVEAGAGVDGRAEPLLRLGELDRVETGRPLLHQVQHHRLGAEPAGRIGGDAGVELHGDAGHRHRGTLRVDDLDAVGEAGALGRREHDRQRAGHARHRLAGAGPRRLRGRCGLGLVGAATATATAGTAGELERLPWPGASS